MAYTPQPTKLFCITTPISYFIAVGEPNASYHDRLYPISLVHTWIMNHVYVDYIRRPTTDTHISITRAAIVFFFQGYFYEAVVQHVTYVIGFCRVCKRVVYQVPFTGNGPPQFSIFRHGRRSCAATCQIIRRSLISVLWFMVPLFLFHCMPAGRHSDSTPDSRRIRRYSRLLPCGSYGACSPTAVVCSRELVSCGNGGTLCCSWVDTRGLLSSVCTLDLFTCAPFSISCVFLGGKA